jgi:NADH-quinone oxidoreductase subunit G
VWLPMRSPGSELRAGLGTPPGGLVRLGGARSGATAAGGAA